MIEEEKQMKPCPFCGSTNIATEESLGVVYCKECSATNDVGNWNIRVPQHQLEQRIKSLQSEIRRARRIINEKNRTIETLKNNNT